MKPTDIAIELNGQQADAPSSENDKMVPAAANGSTNQTEEILGKADVADWIPETPDGGYGWVIVICSLITHFIVDGICYAFGTLLPDYEKYFNSSSAATGALMSTIIGCYLLSGLCVCAKLIRCPPLISIAATLRCFSFKTAVVSDRMMGHWPALYDDLKSIFPTPLQTSAEIVYNCLTFCKIPTTLLCMCMCQQICCG